jgi:hypothetical protein
VWLVAADAQAGFVQAGTVTIKAASPAVRANLDARGKRRVIEYLRRVRLLFTRRAEDRSLPGGIEDKYPESELSDEIH